MNLAETRLRELVERWDRKASELTSQDAQNTAQWCAAELDELIYELKDSEAFK